MMRLLLIVTAVLTLGLMVRRAFVDTTREGVPKAKKRPARRGALPPQEIVCGSCGKTFDPDASGWVCPHCGK